MTRAFLTFAARAYPRRYLDERRSELISTALEASAGSPAAVAREAMSLIAGGLRTRTRLQSPRPSAEIASEGALLCAWALAVVTMAIACAGLTARVHLLDASASGVYLSPSYGPYRIDWWWIGLATIAGALVVSLGYGMRRVAIALAAAVLALVAYDALVLADGSKYDGEGHFDLFTYAQTSSFPGGREWMAAAAVLFVAVTLGTRAMRPLPRPRSAAAFAVAIALALAAVAHEAWGAFFFLRWALLVLLVLAALLVSVEPRLAIAAFGCVVAALPSTAVYLTSSNVVHDTPTTLAVVLGLLLGSLAPLSHVVVSRR